MEVNQRIRNDFKFDLERARFPFADVIRENPDYSEKLLHEFALLPTKPKSYLHFHETITVADWARNCTENKGPVINSSGNQPVMANFIADTEIDKVASRLVHEFNQMLLNNEVPEKYYGQVLAETQTAVALNLILEQMDLVVKYPVLNDNVSDYEGYAIVAVKRLIHLFKQVGIEQMRVDLKNYFLSLGVKAARVMILHMNVDSTVRDGLSERFKILKLFADDIMTTQFASTFPENEVLNHHTELQTKGTMINFGSEFLDSSNYLRVVEKLIANNRVRAVPGEDRLVFVGIRKGALYEAVTIFEAAKDLGYLKRRDYSYSDISAILSNTFLNFSLGARTVRDKKTFKRLEDYKLIIG
jgi:hypothetical protein